MVGTEGLGGSGITGPGVLRATLGPTKEGPPTLRFPSVLRVPPHHGPPQITAGAGGRGSTSAQERINNLFMTFNKTQTSPHWRLIKESVLSTMGRQREWGTGHAFTLRDWGPERVRREEGEGPEPAREEEEREAGGRGWGENPGGPGTQEGKRGTARQGEAKTQGRQTWRTDKGTNRRTK